MDVYFSCFSLFFKRMEAYFNGYIFFTVCLRAEHVVLICGTFFIMAEARQAIGLKEPQDSDVITEVWRQVVAVLLITVVIVLGLVR